MDYQETFAQFGHDVRNGIAEITTYIWLINGTIQRTENLTLSEEAQKLLNQLKEISDALKAIAQETSDISITAQTTGGVSDRLFSQSFASLESRTRQHLEAIQTTGADFRAALKALKIDDKMFELIDGLMDSTAGVYKVFEGYASLKVS